MVKICEIFESLQGEGKTVGKPCVFVRFSGCCLSCSFCDSKHSWTESTEYTSDRLLKEILSFNNALNVVFTGGEPLMQLYTPEVKEVVKNLIQKEHVTFEIETNGVLLDYSELRSMFWRDDVQFNISPKVLNDDWKNLYFNEKFTDELYNITFNYNCQFKFVLTHDDTRELCLDRIKTFIYEHNICHEDVCLMTEGVSKEEQNIENMKDDWELCVEQGWRYTPRLHILIFDKKRKI